MINRLRSFRPILSLLVALAAPVAFAQADHAHDHGDHSHGEVEKAASFAEAVRRITDELAELDGALASGAALEVSERANTISALAAELGRLALAKDSGVARESVRAANLAGKALATAAGRLHEAADIGDLNGARAEAPRLREILAQLDAVAPAVYFCPMHCEGAKTYTKPGECPVCHMALKKQTTERYSVEVSPVGGAALAPGKAATLAFVIRDPRGMPVTELEIVHEQILHLLMVSEDLSWYAHEHPAVAADGSFTLDWTFPNPGRYILFHDFTPPGVGMQVVAVELTVPGDPPARKPLVADADAPKTIGDYTFSLDTGPGAAVGGSSTLAFTVTRDGEPVDDLVPYLGAMGHLVIISEDLAEFVHSHPHESSHDADRVGGPRVEFDAHFRKPGLYKAWGQFQHDGQILTAPFTFNVAKADRKTANLVCPITGDAINEFHTRQYEGQTVGFCDGDCALKWDAMSAETRARKFADAVAGTTRKVPHGHQDGDHDHH